jgi:hypothetical protein
VTLVLARLKDAVLAILQSTLVDSNKTFLEPGSVEDAVNRLSAELAGEALQESEAGG